MNKVVLVLVALCACVFAETIYNQIGCAYHYGIWDDSGDYHDVYCMRNNNRIKYVKIIDDEGETLIRCDIRDPETGKRCLGIYNHSTCEPGYTKESEVSEIYFEFDYVIGNRSSCDCPENITSDNCTKFCNPEECVITDDVGRFVAVEWHAHERVVYMYKEDVPSVSFFDGIDCDGHPLTETIDYCSSTTINFNIGCAYHYGIWDDTDEYHDVYCMRNGNKILYSKRIDEDGETLIRCDIKDPEDDKRCFAIVNESTCKPSYARESEVSEIYYEFDYVGKPARWECPENITAEYCTRYCSGEQCVITDPEMHLVAIEWNDYEMSVFLWQKDVPSASFFDSTDCEGNPLAEAAFICPSSQSSATSSQSNSASESAAFLTQASVAVIVFALLMMLL